MERLVTSVDQHGRMLIPLHIRERLNVLPGKVTLEVNQNQITFISDDDTIEEMHALFTKNKKSEKNSIIDDFISLKHQEYRIEEARSKKDV